MDYKVNIGYLKKEMLIHEIIVRGVSVDETKTVEQLRSILRPLLKMEKSGACSFVPYSLKFDVERVQIRLFLDEANNTIPTISGEASQGKYVATQSRLVHLLERVKRIPESTLSAEERSERTELLIDVLAALDHLETVVRGDPELSRHLDHHEFHMSSPVHNSTHHRLVPQAPNVPIHTKSPNLEKWNLKFSGDPKLSVHNFLERVAELSKARNVTENQLYDCAIDLFSGKALNWYRANRDRFDSWETLCELLRRHFEPPDYRARLFKEILERTQDTSESIVDYLSCMQALFRRYDGLTPETQLDILSRNLSPFYTTQLPVVNSLEELEHECLKLETKKYRAEHYVPPSRKRQQFVEPDFAFVGVDQPTSDAVNNSVFNDNTNSFGVDRIDLSNNGPQRPRPQNHSSNLICWNCQNSGHLNRDCPNPRKTHCYRCGTPNVTVRNCPKCGNSGNGPRGNH